MIPIYLGLLLAALVLAGVAVEGGLAIAGAEARGAAVERHQLLGLFAAVLLLVVQCAVFVYFLGTGKAIKVAVETRGLDPQLARETRKLKGKTFPFATFAALAVVVGSVLAGSSSPRAHAIGMSIALGLTLLSAPFEIRSIRTNSRLMDRTADALDVAESAPGVSLADPDAAPPAFVAGRLLLVAAASAWLVFAYRVLVMRASDEPWPLDAAVSAGAAVAGLPLYLSSRRSRSRASE